MKNLRVRKVLFWLGVFLFMMLPVVVLLGTQSFDKGSLTQVMILAVIGIWAIIPLKKYVYEEEK